MVNIRTAWLNRYSGILLASCTPVYVPRMALNSKSEIFLWTTLTNWSNAVEVWSVANLTFQSLPVTWCTTSLTFNNCTFCPYCSYVFCVYLRTNSDLCHLQHKLIGFYYQCRTQEFCSGGGSANSIKDRENGDPGGGSPLVRGSGGSCNLVQEISFHIVIFS